MQLPQVFRQPPFLIDIYGMNILSLMLCTLEKYPWRYALEYILFQSPVALDLDMDAVLNQFAEEVTFHICFYDAAGKVDSKDIFKTDDGAICTG